MAKPTGKISPLTTVTKPAVNKPDRSLLRLCLLLAAIVAIVYGNTLKNGYAVDDNIMLVGNKFVAQGVAGIPTLLVTPHQRGFWSSIHDEYRPLSLMLFAAEYQLWQLSPAGYHFMNILLFAGCVVLLFLFLHELMARSKIGVAFIAAVLFAIHPIHTEVVANVKSSDELLSFVLAFGGMLLGMRYMRQGKPGQLAATALCFLLAHLAKESVVTLIVIVPLVFFFFINEHRRRAIHLSAAFAAAAIIFIIARYAVLAYWQADTMPAATMLENALQTPGLSYASRLATAILMMGMYLKLAFVPWPLIDDYSITTIPFVQFSSPWVLLTITVYAALAVAAIRRFIKDRRDLYAFAIFFFLVTIALFSNIFITIKATMGERFLFYPSVGVCLAMALLLCRWAGAAGIDALRSSKVMAILIPLCLLGAGATIARNPDWMDNGSLYGADVVKAPNNAHLNYFYGYDLFTQGKQTQDPVARARLLGEGISYFRRALAVYPQYSFALCDMAAAFFCAGQNDSAVVYNLKAIANAPYYDLPRNNLSGVYLNGHRYAEEIALCKETIRMIPGDGDAYGAMGYSYKQLGKPDTAMYYTRMGMNIAPRYIPLYQVMSDIYYMLGNRDSAQYYAQAARALSGQ